MKREKGGAENARRQEANERRALRDGCRQRWCGLLPQERGGCHEPARKPDKRNEIGITLTVGFNTEEYSRSRRMQGKTNRKRKRFIDSVLSVKHVEFEFQRMLVVEFDFAGSCASFAKKKSAASLRQCE